MGIINTKIHRKGDIFFLTDNFKRTGSGHFYYVYETSNGYRKQNLCLQCTSNADERDQLIRIAINQGEGKNIILTKIKPMNIFEVPDNAFISQNYRGYVEQDSELAKLIEASVMDRLHTHQFDGCQFNPITEWIRDWNRRMADTFGDSIENTSNKISSEAECENLPLEINLDSVDYAKLQRINAVIFENVFPEKMATLHKLFEVYNELKVYVTEYSTYREDAYNVVKIMDEINNSVNVTAYASHKGVNNQVMYMRIRKMLTNFFNTFTTITLPTDVHNKKYTDSQISKLNKDSLHMLKAFFKSLEKEKYEGVIKLIDEYIKLAK